MVRTKKMPRKGRKPDRIYRGERLRTDRALWVKRKILKVRGKDDITGRCPKHYHSAPAYDTVHSHKQWCLKDCARWKPPRYFVGKKGACGPEKLRRRSMKEWILGLRAHYEHARNDDPDYSYAQAQHDYSEIYKRTHKKK
jgi:hypothetical protein